MAQTHHDALVVKLAAGAVGRDGQHPDEVRCEALVSPSRGRLGGSATGRTLSGSDACASFVVVLSIGGGTLMRSGGRLCAPQWLTRPMGTRGVPQIEMSGPLLMTTLDPMATLVRQRRSASRHET